MKQLSQKRADQKLAKVLKRERKNAKPMTTYKHIVQVHPVELGEPNLYKVKEEFEFFEKSIAMACVEDFNERYEGYQKAVYVGRVNDATGELE